MLLTGAPPSVVRATVMAIVIIVSLLSNRSTNLINSISIAALIILAINPNELYNPGFQLSFAAVLAIGILLPYMNHIIERWNIQSKSLIRHRFVYKSLCNSQHRIHYSCSDCYSLFCSNCTFSCSLFCCG